MAVQTPPPEAPPAGDDLREQAAQRLHKRQDFGTHLLVYLVVNALVWSAWAVTGTGYPWPVWLTACWGVGLIANAWDVYGRRPITEEDIQAEMDRLRRR